MRNIAARWHRDGNLVSSVPEIEVPGEDDELRRVEDQSEAEDMLVAFRGLPDRWQRVLWLVEVDEVPRPQIATELGINPNAVSVLYRRARSGLRLNWLEHQVPQHLRDDTSHVAHLLPKTMMAKSPAPLSREVSTHLDACDTCNRVYGELRTAKRNMSRGTLAAAGFAALGVALPAASTASMTALGVGGGALLVGGVGIGTMLAAASVGVLLVGGAVTAGIGLWNQTQASAERTTTQQDSGSAEKDASAEQSQGGGQGTTVSTGGSSTSLGRGSTDTSINELAFVNSSDPNDFYIPPTVPKPNGDGETPGPGSDPDSPLTPGVSNPTTSQGYLAPILSGTSTPGATIVVELTTPTGISGSTRSAQYSVATGENGTWSFDLRPLGSTIVGSYSYTVWAVHDGIASPSTSGTFELMPVGLTGFESIEPFEMVPLGEASTTGIVFEVRGDPNGTVCLSSVYAGQSVEIPLDAQGVAVRRLRLLSAGTYWFYVQACTTEHRGPALEQFVDVEGPAGQVYGPSGPDPSLTEFEVSEL